MAHAACMQQTAARVGQTDPADTAAIDIAAFLTYPRGGLQCYCSMYTTAVVLTPT